MIILYDNKLNVSSLKAVYTTRLYLFGVLLQKQLLVCQLLMPFFICWNLFFYILPFQRSGNAVLGIPYALASLSYCQSFNLDLLKASATLVLAELWLSLGPNHAKKALALLHSCFPMLLGHGGLELRSRALIMEAKCYLADPDFSGILLLYPSFIVFHLQLLRQS